MHHGDHKRNEQGFPQQIEGAMELIQRAMIRLSVPRGSFSLDQNLGSRLYELSSYHGIQQNMEELALEYAREALLELKDVRVVSVKKASLEPENLRLEFELESSGEVPQHFQAVWELNC